MIVKCLKCGTGLTGEVNPAHYTTCPGCGKRWWLNPDHQAIRDVALEVQSVDHRQDVPKIGDIYG